jgi:hypothetical protein
MHEKYGMLKNQSISITFRDQNLSLHENWRPFLRIILSHYVGTVVRTGPNTLSFTTSTALAAIHGNHAGNVKRASWYETLDASSGAHSIESVINKSEHAIRRRFMAKAFSDKALREQEVYIDTNAQRFVKAVTSDLGKDGWSSPKNFTRETTWYGFDFVGDLSFGSNFGMVESEENRYVWDLLRGTSVFVYAVGIRLLFALRYSLVISLY